MGKDEKKKLEKILEQIRRGLPEDYQETIDYLDGIQAKYKGHEQEQEIMMECIRLLLAKEDAEEKRKERLQEQDFQLELGFMRDLEDVEKELKKVEKLSRQERYGEALERVSALAQKAEAMVPSGRRTALYSFEEPMEEVLFLDRFPSSAGIEYLHIPFTQIYAIYGGLLFEKGDLEQARKVLQRGLVWNPTSFRFLAESIETFKLEGGLEDLLTRTLEAFRVAIHAPQVARCYRNLGYYFVERELYQVAISAYTLSLAYDHESVKDQVRAELAYIEQKGGKRMPLSWEKIERHARTYGFPMSCDERICDLAYTYGSHHQEQGNAPAARYFFGILYELTKDEEIQKLLKKLPKH